MRDRLQKLKADAGRDRHKADGESAVLAKIATLPQPDRAMKDRRAREESGELRTEPHGTSP